MTRRDIALLLVSAAVIFALLLIGRSQPRAGVAYHEPEDGVQPWDVPWTWTSA
jgi:hypothetical protein